jgi:hypothetical protein
MCRCGSCGARIAPSSYQVLAADLDATFCSASCAERALARARRQRPLGLPALPPTAPEPGPPVSPELALVDETLRQVV